MIKQREACLEYLDFELEIGSGTGREYPVAVVRSPAGEAHETMRFPFDQLALENRLQALQIALLRSGGKHRQVLSPEAEAVQEFGRALFNAALTGEVRTRYDVSRREAAGQGKGLRLKLRIQPPELAALPWEFLYDPRQAEFVCLSRGTPVVRYLELAQPIQPLSVTPPLRILGMIASPRDLPWLDVEHERQRVEEAIKSLRAGGLADLTWLEGPTWRDLQKAMRGGPWHVFHFIGHGGFDRNADEGIIALADEEGRTHRLRATELGRLLADHYSLRLALLNGCEGARGSERDIFSSTAAILVRRGIPAVLSMQYEITDQAAIEFARAFYEALADGMAVDAAVAEARKSVSLAVTNTVEWGTPVLHMRSPDGILFDIQRKALKPQLPSTSPPPKPGLSEPGVAYRWLRGLPLPARAGLLVLLLLLAGAFAVWRGGDRKQPSISPIVTFSPTTIPKPTPPQPATPTEAPEPTETLTTGLPSRPSAGEQPTTGLPEATPIGGLTLSQQRVLYPGAGQVSHVAFSPDGSRLVSGAESAVTIWNAQTGGALIAIPLGMPARAPDVAFSPDGKWVAGTVDLVVMLWDAETGELLREFGGHTLYPISLAFSPDGSRLVSGAEDYSAILWDVQTGQQISALTTYGTRGVAFAPDGTMFAVSSGFDVLLADATTGGQARSLKGHTANVNDVAFSSDGQKIASASRIGTVIVWEVSTGQRIYRLSATPEALYGVAFSPDGALLAASTGRGRILVWEMSTGNLLVRFDAHEGEIYDLAFSPDGRTLASASADTTIGLWNVKGTGQ